MGDPRSVRRWRFAELAVALGIVVTLTGWLLFEVGRVREAAARSS